MTQARSEFLNELLLLKSDQKDQKPISDKVAARSINPSATREQTGNRPRARIKGIWGQWYIANINSAFKTDAGSKKRYFPQNRGKSPPVALEMQGAQQQTMTSHWTPATPPRRCRHYNFLIAAISNSLVVKSRHLFCYRSWWPHFLECHGELRGQLRPDQAILDAEDGINVGKKKKPLWFSVTSAPIVFVMTRCNQGPECCTDTQGNLFKPWTKLPIFQHPFIPQNTGNVRVLFMAANSP